MNIPPILQMGKVRVRDAKPHAYGLPGRTWQAGNRIQACQTKNAMFSILMPSLRRGVACLGSENEKESSGRGPAHSLGVQGPWRDGGGSLQHPFQALQA